MSRRQPSLCLVKHWSADRNVCIWVGADSLNERATATWRYRSAGSRSEHLPLGAQGPSLLAQLCAVAYALRALATSWELGSLFLRQVHIVGDTENSENEGRGDDTRAVSVEEDPWQSTTSASRSLGAPQPVGPWESPDTRPKGVPLLRHAAWRRASNTSARWRLSQIRFAGQTFLGRFAHPNDLVGLASSQVPEREDGRQMLGARANLPLFPVVDRLGGCADQKAAFSS